MQLFLDKFLILDKPIKNECMKDNYFKFSPSVFLIPFFFVLLMWIVYWIEIRFNLNLENFGIYPRELTGLRGVILSPFLHGNFEHLFNNSIPIFILFAALIYFYREQSLQIIGYGILFSGLITWVIGRASYHIGASGLVYVLVSFIFFKGLMTKYYRLVALSLAVILVYGSLIWYVFPNVAEGISWEGHLAGVVTGLAFALYFKTPEYTKMNLYDWEKPDFNPEDDKFLQRFDENGNFVNLPKPEIEEDSFTLDGKNSNPNFKIVYDFIEDKEALNEKNELRPKP